MSDAAHRSIRVVVADDSAVMRRVITALLIADDRIEVIGEALDGHEALDACARLKPDVLTLDLSMPNSNGLEVLAQLQPHRGSVQVVVVSSFAPSLIERALDVLSHGAVDLVAKPRPGGSFDDFGDELIRAVSAAASIAPRLSKPLPAPRQLAIPQSTVRSKHRDRVLVIASSTGGPSALGELLPQLDLSGSCGAVVVQHMPIGFTSALARRLDDVTRCNVREARIGDRLARGGVLIAPAGHHMRIDVDGIRLDGAAAIGGVRPRADLTIRDLVELHGDRVVLAVLTGMGNDGLDGARAVRAAGGIVLAQDASDCVVYGMPRQIIEHDLADATGTLSELATLIQRALATPSAR